VKSFKKNISSLFNIYKLDKKLLLIFFKTSLYSSTFETIFMYNLYFKNKYNYKIISIDNKKYIFDPIRKKKIVLTPEEWVRQNVISFLNLNLKIPISHISVEKGFKVNKLKKRFDIIVYDDYGKIKILVECKSPKISLNQKALDQLIVYNMEIKSKFLMLTNGLNHFFVKFDDKKFSIINNLPNYNKL